MKYTNAFRRLHGLAAATVLLLGTAAAPLHAAHPGDPDPSFDQDGYLWTDFFDTSEELFALTPMSDGRFVAAGVVVGTNASGSGTSENVALARYLPNGALDDSFGIGGLKQVDIEGGTDVARAVKLLPDRGILVGATLTTGAHADFGLLKFRHDGSLDPTFGELDAGSTRKGYVRLNVGGTIIHDDLAAIAVAADGKIYAAGITRQQHANGFAYQHVALARFTAAGDPDTSFGAGAGFVVLETFLGDESDLLTGIALDQAGNPGADGRIVLVGYTPNRNNAFITRLTAAGIEDTSFGGGDGFVTIQSGNAGGVATGISTIVGARLARDGKIVVLGEGTDRGMTVMRFNANGSLDTAFGTGGRTTVKLSGISDYDQPSAIALQGNGKIVAAGYATNRASGTPNKDFFVARLLANGQPDAGFGDGQARAVVTISPVDDGASAIQVEPSGHLLVGGYQGRTGIVGRDFAVLRVIGDADRIFANGFDGPGFD